MKKNRFELDPERLATTDESGHRIYLYPEDVDGIWKKRRTLVYWLLIAVYLVLPWIYINGKPALMLNIFTREFTFFGSTFHGIEPILAFLVVVSGIFFIAFMTSLFGRVWCGWGCPQTVFIQSIFMKIESFIEGNGRKRKELDEAPWSLEKAWKRTVKWILYIIISSHIAHTFIGYIVGPHELFEMTMQSPLQNFGVFLAVSIATLIVLLDFGWFREQFCIIACPYGRMQSVIMDENSMVIAYDQKRGEPRRGAVGKEMPEGDCINCYHCVKVCPTGIDIRRGTQLECIACTLCIDACDEIMIKIKKPTGLIRYSSQNELEGKPWKKFSIRSMFYILMSVVLLATFVFFLNKSTNLSLVFMRGKTPFTTMQTNGVEIIRNHFTLKLTHQGSDQYTVGFKVEDPALAEKIQIVTPVNPTVIDRPEKKIIIFFNFSKDILENGTRRVNVQVIDSKNNTLLAMKEVVLVGPVN